MDTNIHMEFRIIVASRKEGKILGLKVEVKRNFSSTLYYLHIFEGEQIQMCAYMYIHQEITDLK